MLDLTPTSVVETRLVEADLGRCYRTGHDLPATRSGYPVHLRPHRVRGLYRRPRAGVNRLASADWVVTQLVVIGRPVLALVRHELDGGPLPAERQRTFATADLATAPDWVTAVARTLARVDAGPLARVVPNHRHGDPDDPCVRECDEDVSAAVARGRWEDPGPPASPLAGDPPDPRVLTIAERDRLGRLRDEWSWYPDHAAGDAVRFLLGLVDRLTVEGDRP